MRGAILPLRQYVFMAWCSVKAQGQLYLTPSIKGNATHEMWSFSFTVAIACDWTERKFCISWLVFCQFAI